MTETITTKHNPTEDAERILAETWDDSLPVDPVVIARALGIRVVKAHLDPDGLVRS